jgi:serine/threonine protein kinase
MSHSKPDEEKSLRSNLSTATVHSVVEIGAKIGAGGFGVVRAGKLKSTGEPVAIKQILPQHYHTRESKLAALREVSLLKRVTTLHNSNILKFISAHEENAGTIQARLVIITELVQGGELFDEIIALGHYSEKNASSLIKKLCEALHIMHENGIIHRDIKPENVLLRSKTAESEPVLADFGLALCTDEKEKPSKNFVGTHAYLSPEVIREHIYGPFSDVWAIGVLAFILLGGYMPFNDGDDETKATLLNNIKALNYSLNCPEWAPMSAESKDLISKIFVADPKQRITIPEILAHPWITHAAPDQHLQSSVAKIKAFNARRKIRATIETIIFSARIFGAAREAASTPSSKEEELAVSLGKTKLDAIREAFAKVSKAGHGGKNLEKTVSVIGFNKMCKELGIASDENVTDKLFSLFDQDMSGDLDYRELVSGILSLRKDFSKSVDLVFSVYDVDGDGYISREELIQLLMVTTHATDAEESKASLLKRLNALFERIDANHDGKISKDEFILAFPGEDHDALAAPVSPLIAKSS